MAMDMTPRPPRYFWDTWLAGISAGSLYVVFLLLSLADLVATVRLMQAHFEGESNGWALWALHAGGWPGFILYKTLLVGVIIGALAAVDRTRPHLARLVLLAACGLMGAVALRHLAIMLAHVMLGHV